MQIVNEKYRDQKNYIVEIARPLPIHWYIDIDEGSFSFGTVAQNIEPILTFLFFTALSA